MDFLYTKHAEEKIRERKLKKAVIEDIIKNPNIISTSRFGRRIVQKKVGDKSLLVVYEKDQSVYIVITAYYTELKRYE